MATIKINGKLYEIKTNRTDVHTEIKDGEVWVDGKFITKINGTIDIDYCKTD